MTIEVPPQDDIPMVQAVAAGPVSINDNPQTPVASMTSTNTVSPSMTASNPIPQKVPPYEPGTSYGAIEEGEVAMVPTSTSVYPNNPSVTTPKPDFNYEGEDPHHRFGPKGRWSHGLCSCCSLFCQPLFWMGWCCTPLVYGQLMTRLKLDWCGKPDKEYAGSKTFGIVAIIFIAYLIASLCGLDVLGIVFLIYTLIIFTRARHTLRRRFRIPVTTCFRCCNGKLEDCCCGFWCNCCSGIQMVRHTHHEDRYPYVACEASGLPTWAPVLPDEEDDPDDEGTFVA